MDFGLAIPDEVCAELGARARTRRVQLNLSIEEMAHRTGLSELTISKFERSGRSTLATFVRVLESLNAVSEMQPVLAGQTRSIEEMRNKVAVHTRQRAYTKKRAAR